MTWLPYVALHFFEIRELLAERMERGATEDGPAADR